MKHGGGGGAGALGIHEVLALMGLLGRLHGTCSPTPSGEPPHRSAWGGGRLAGVEGGSCGKRVCVADPLCFVTTPPLCPLYGSRAGISQVDPK